MKKINKTFIVIAILTGIVLLTEGFIKYNKPVYKALFPTNVQGATFIVDDARFDSWIYPATPDVDVFVLPAESPNFEGDNITALDASGNITVRANNNLDFHRWAEQMFLWILSPVPSDGSYGNCGGLVLNSKEFYDFDFVNGIYKKHFCPFTDPIPLKGYKNTVNVANSMSFEVKGANKGNKNLPILIEEGTNKVFDVDKTPIDENHNQLIYDANKNKIEVGNIDIINEKPVFYNLKGEIIEKPSLMFSDSLDEKTTVQQFVFNKNTFTISSILGSTIFIMSSQGQAQNGNVLMARNGSLVYYNIMVNDVAAVFSTMVYKGVANGGLPNTSKFPTTQAELDVIKAYALAHNFPLVNTNNRALAMEVKTSWVETINFTSTPPLPTAVNPPPYLGDYITISTFVPNYIQTSTTTWTLNMASPKRLATLALVGMHVVGSVKGHPEMIWSTFEHENNSPNNLFECNDTSGSSNPIASDITTKNWLFCNPTATLTPITNFDISNIFLNGANISATTGHTISPSNTLRIKPFGWNGPGNPVGNTPEIPLEGISNARLIALKMDVDNNLINGDIRKKYYQVGATWNSKIKPGKIHVGTIALSNATMETTTQNTMSCFSCHASELGPNRDMPRLTSLSHVFGGSLIP